MFWGFRGLKVWGFRGLKVSGGFWGQWGFKGLRFRDEPNQILQHP